MKTKFLILFGLALGLLNSVSALEITVAGSSVGVISPAISGLTYADGGAFTQDTNAGLYGISGIGTFTAGAPPINSAGSTFTLTVTFTSPSVISGGNPLVLSQTIV